MADKEKKETGENVPLPLPEKPEVKEAEVIKDTPLPPAPEKPVLPTLSQETRDHLALSQYEDVSRAGFPTDKILSTMSIFANHCIQTGQMPKTIDTVAKAIMVFQAGRELGIPPIESLNSLYFVNNHLSLYGPVVVRRIRRFATIEYGLCTATEATVTIIRKDDGTELSSTVTMKDLEARGITGGKDTFKKHPRTMLIYKAIGEIVRHIVPEAVGAMAVEGDFDEQGTTTPAPRRGRTISNTETVVTPLEEEQIPSGPEVARKYSLETIKNRLVELGAEIDPKATKGMLAGKLVEILRERKENHA